MMPGISLGLFFFFFFFQFRLIDFEIATFKFFARSIIPVDLNYF